MERNYRTDIDGNQYYTENSPDSVTFIKVNGDEIYAKDKFSREYYPNTGQVAKTKNGKPIYALGPDGKVIFMKNKYGDEIYLKDDDKNDYVIRNLRYARKKDNSTYYPILKNENGQYFEKLLRNRYAKDSSKKLFYPLDEMGHERWYEEPAEQPDEYPITSDNLYLVPQKDGKPYFMDNLEPKLTIKDIKSVLERTDGSIAYVTSVQSRSRKSRGIYKHYDTKPFEVLEDSSSKDSNGVDDPKPDTNLDEDSSEESSSESEYDSENEDEEMEIDNNNEDKSNSDKSNDDNNKKDQSNSDKSNGKKSPKTPPNILITPGIFRNDSGGFNFYVILISLITIIFGICMWYLKIRNFL